MEKRQKRILNQNGMQALSPTHGVNIVVGYFTRQQPHDYEFAMHRLREDAGQLFGRGGGPSVVMMSQKNDISLTLCKIDSTARLPFFVICSVFICHKSGDANTKIPNSNTPETEHGMQSLECCDDRGRKGSGRGPSCISTTNIFSKWLRKGPS
jgi:hypothetical protein